MNFGRKRGGNGNEGRNPHHGGGPWQQADNLLRIETGQKKHRAASQQRDVGRNEKPVRVEDRQGVQQNVFRAKTPIFDQGLGIGVQVAVGEHRPFGAPRSAGGIGNGC